MGTDFVQKAPDSAWPTHRPLTEEPQSLCLVQGPSHLSVLHDNVQVRAFSAMGM